VGVILVTALRRPAVTRPELVPPVVLSQPVPGRPEYAPAPGTAELSAGHTSAAQPISLAVGFGDSEPARRALGWGADLLRARPGTLHVYAGHPLIDSDLSGFAHSELEDTRDQRAAGVADAAAQIAAAAGLPYTFERRQESPAGAILSAASVQGAAEPGSAPVIVTGRSHHAAHQIIGSVPVRLLHQSPYPVLTIA
jgi:nucleotide-binding universal stress UspA family protein